MKAERFFWYQTHLFGDRYISPGAKSDGLEILGLTTGMSRRYVPITQYTDQVDCVLSLPQSDEGPSLLHQPCSKSGPVLVSTHHLTALMAPSSAWSSRTLDRSAEALHPRGLPTTSAHLSPCRPERRRDPGGLAARAIVGCPGPL